MFEDFINLFTKEQPLRPPEEYDGVVFQINRYLSMEDSLLPIACEFGKHLFSMGGMYYHLLYTFIPKTDKKLFIKYIRNKKLDDIEASRVKALQQALNYNGRQAYGAMQVLRGQGVDIDRIFGIDTKDKDSKE